MVWCYVDPSDLKASVSGLECSIGIDHCLEHSGFEGRSLAGVSFARGYSPPMPPPQMRVEMNPRGGKGGINSIAMCTKYANLENDDSDIHKETRLYGPRTWDVPRPPEEPTIVGVNV